MQENQVKICLSLAGKTIDENLRILEQYRDKVDLVELRADFLEPSEKFYIRIFPEKARIPSLLSIRRASDGGKFTDGEGVRLVLFAKALSYARSDVSANYAYVELEDDFHIPAIEEACRTFGTRIVRSHHYQKGLPENLDEALAALSREDDEIPRLDVAIQSSGEALRFLRWWIALPPAERIFTLTGVYGLFGHILSSRLGSMWTYARSRHPSDASDRFLFDPAVLHDIYHLREYGPQTELYALLGQKSIAASLSPLIHNTAFRTLEKNALFFPLVVDRIEDGLALLELLGCKGAAITVPFKEDVLPYLAFRSTDVQRIGACNTLVLRDGAWAGYNTDADGFERSLMQFLGRTDLEGMRATIIGAGGAAKSVALSLYRKGAHCLILNRTIMAARELARKYNFLYGHLDDRSIDLISSYSELIVQATSVGMDSEDDPLNFYEFKGTEAVFDLVYHPPRTALLKRAEAAGCQVTNGYRMLCYQAAGQYKLWMNEPPPEIYAHIEP
ncbi:MAG: type I 3-dehydroquinate dehydratase [Spirochaetaceae bacterium]|nr:type I 3-dehydroquinate dehydratase [Spirochaetaceae bacterium]